MKTQMRSVYNCLIWGIWQAKDTPRTEAESSIVNSIITSAFGGARKSDSWLWFASAHEIGFEPGFQDWSNNSKPWLAFLDGSLVERILELADQVHQAFDGRPELLTLDEIPPATNAKMTHSDK
jgi:hypothetical protein